MLRLAIVGAGWIGSIHARACAVHRQARLVAVVDRDLARAQALAARHGATAFDSLEAVPPEAFDAAIISTATHTHLALAEACARRGAHLLVEKPLCNLDQDSSRLRALVRERGLVAMMGMTHRYYPEARRARELLDQGAIGDLVAINDVILMRAGEEELPGWYFDPGQAGGGAMITNGVHSIDRIRWLSGREVREVVAASARSLSPHHRTDDASSATLLLEGGVQATTVQLWTRARITDCRIELYGSEGVLVVQSWQGLTLSTPYGREAATFYAPDQEQEARFVEGIRAEQIAWLEGIASGHSPVDLEDGERTMEVLRRIYARASEQAT